MPNITNLATNAAFHAIINKVKNKIPSINNLATVDALTDCMFFPCHVRVSEWIYTLQLPECQGTCSK